MKFDGLRWPKGIVFILPLVILTVIFFDIPIFLMLGTSFSNPLPTMQHYTYLFNNAAYLQIVMNTFRIALIVTIISAILGYPLAFWMTRLSRRGQMITVTIVVMSFLVSILVRAYAWIVILGNNGIVNHLLLKLKIISHPIQIIYNEFGVTIGTLNVLLPFMILPMYAAMLKFDTRLLKAASSLGARPFTVFYRVYFPLTLPPLASSAILIFIMTLGFFITPAILGGGNVAMVANVLDMLINQLSEWEVASALSVLLLLVTLLFYAGYRRIGDVK